MSKTWYPLINDDLCIQCGACVDKCSHGVYDREQAPQPMVVFPDGCVEGCRGCGSLCPAEAISYFGDNGAAAENCGCGRNCSEDCGC